MQAPTPAVAENLRHSADVRGRAGPTPRSLGDGRRKKTQKAIASSVVSDDSALLRSTMAHSMNRSTSLR